MSIREKCFVNIHSIIFLFLAIQASSRKPRTCHISSQALCCQ